MKMATEHLLPLSSQTQDVLEEHEAGRNADVIEKQLSHEERDEAFEAPTTARNACLSG
jgi:hypothetical protein